MIEIDSRSSKPIYEQIVDKIKENILKGIFISGDKLPSVRELSSMIQVNPNTISKAYNELERQKVIETLRGRGTYVCELKDIKINEERGRLLREELKKLIVEGHYIGIKKEALVTLINEIYSEFDGEKQGDSDDKHN